MGKIEYFTGKNMGKNKSRYCFKNIIQCSILIIQSNEPVDDVFHVFLSSANRFRFTLFYGISVKVFQR